MRHALSAALFAGVFLTSLTPPPALAMPVAKSTTVEASVEKVGYWRRHYRRYWRRGYPVPYAYYPPAYGYYAPPPARCILPAIRLRSASAAKRRLRFLSARIWRRRLSA